MVLLNPPNLKAILRHLIRWKIQHDAQALDLVDGLDGASRLYAPIEYPAVAHHEVLRDRQLGIREGPPIARVPLPHRPHLEGVGQDRDPAVAASQEMRPPRRTKRIEPHRLLDPFYAFVGAPLPMTVLQQIRVGRFFSRFALRMAASTASTSWPSTSMACQPKASARLR